MEEIWKDVEGWEGIYQVSNMGRVRSMPRMHNCIHPYMRKVKILKPRVCGKSREYLSVCFHCGDKIKQYKIHRLVAMAFCPNPNGYNEVNHKNEIKGDNRAENLEWCSRSYNVPYNNIARRRSVSMMKKVCIINDDGSIFKSFNSYAEAAEFIGCESYQVTKAIKRNGRCRGYKFKTL